MSIWSECGWLVILGSQWVCILFTHIYMTKLSEGCYLPFNRWILYTLIFNPPAGLLSFIPHLYLREYHQTVYIPALIVCMTYITYVPLMLTNKQDDEGSCTQDPSFITYVYRWLFGFMFTYMSGSVILMSAYSLFELYRDYRRVVIGYRTMRIAKYCNDDTDSSRLLATVWEMGGNSSWFFISLHETKLYIFIRSRKRMVCDGSMDQLMRCIEHDNISKKYDKRSDDTVGILLSEANNCIDKDYDIGEQLVGGERERREKELEDAMDRMFKCGVCDGNIVGAKVVRVCRRFYHVDCIYRYYRYPSTECIECHTSFDDHMRVSVY